MLKPELQKCQENWHKLLRGRRKMCSASAWVLLKQELFLKSLIDGMKSYINFHCMKVSPKIGPRGEVEEGVYIQTEEGHCFCIIVHNVAS